ncbi:M23 family metallopeptidase [Bacillaceae bacterium Marseille-Q3522]|nr:M23 family metallopeptidase [Bacillaceae bacterium Marseille-Q3522]
MSRKDELRKRIEKRNRQRKKSQLGNETKIPWMEFEAEEQHGFDKITSLDGETPERKHPLFHRDAFIFKVLASVCLVLITGILFKDQGSEFQQARVFVTNVMQEDFQFAQVADWYEERFGQPLAFFPFSPEKKESDADKMEYSLPASANILEEFQTNGQRMTIETGTDSLVVAMSDGLITFIGDKEGFGKTIIIQHPDKSESWYGNIKEVDAALYGRVSKGMKLGTANVENQGEKAYFYLALKQDNQFVDPIQVIPFE